MIKALQSCHSYTGRFNTDQIIIKMKILLVAGTRPEAIKLAPVSFALNNDYPSITNLFCATGQHDLLLDQALDSFGIFPDIRLRIMRENQTISYVFSETLRQIDEVIQEYEPDAIIVQGTRRPLPQRP